MARRRKRFGAVASRPSKGPAYKPRRFSISVSVMRTTKYYSAVACPKLRTTRERATWRAVNKRCENGTGMTPTEAVKRALSALSRKLK